MKLKLLSLLPFVLLSSCTIINGYNYEDDGFVALSDNSVTLNNIKNVTVDWVNGSISLEQSEEDYLFLSETRTDYPLYYKVTNETLTIKLAKSGMPSRIINKMDKKLYLVLPKEFGELQLDTVDTYVNSYTDLTIDKAVLNNVNGYFGTQTYHAKETELNGVGTSYSFSYLSVKTENSINLEINTVQSDINIGFDKVDGFDIKWTGVQSTYSTDYGDMYSFGAERIKINFKGVKSNLSMFTVYRYEPAEGE